MRRAIWLLFGVVLGLQGCASARLTPVDTAVVTERPASTVGPLTLDPPRPWVRVDVRSDYGVLKVLADWDMTFHTYFTDCEKGRIGRIDEFYLDGQSLNTPTFDVKPYRKQDVIIATYLEKTYYDAHPVICLEANGGSMAGMSIRSNRIRVK